MEDIYELLETNSEEAFHCVTNSIWGKMIDTANIYCDYKDLDALMDHYGLIGGDWMRMEDMFEERYRLGSDSRETRLWNDYIRQRSELWEAEKVWNRGRKYLERLHVTTPLLHIGEFPTMAHEISSLFIDRYKRRILAGTDGSDQDYLDLLLCAAENVRIIERWAKMRKEHPKGWRFQYGWCVPEEIIAKR